MTTPINLHDDLLEIPEVAALPAGRAAELVDSVYSTLEAVVGARLSAALTEELLDDFAAVLAYEQKHPGLEGSPASDWLEVHVPNYHAVVLQEYSRVLESIRSDPARAIRAVWQKPLPAPLPSVARGRPDPGSEWTRPRVHHAHIRERLNLIPDQPRKETPCPKHESSPTAF